MIRRSYSWVPAGMIRVTYSAPTIATMKARRLRLIVETNSRPPGRSSVASACIVAAGSGTCSSISMQVTTSNVAGSAAASDSTGSRR